MKIFHFLHGGRKFLLTETRERFEQQGDNSFDESKKGAVGCFMTELTGKNKVQTISSVRGQNSNKNNYPDRIKPSLVTELRRKLKAVK